MSGAPQLAGVCSLDGRVQVSRCAAGSLRPRSRSIHIVRGSRPRHWPRPPVDFCHLPAFAVAGSLSCCLVAPQSALGCPPRATPHWNLRITRCRLAKSPTARFPHSSHHWRATAVSTARSIPPYMKVSRPPSGLLEQRIETTCRSQSLLVRWHLPVISVRASSRAHRTRRPSPLRARL